MYTIRIRDLRSEHACIQYALEITQWTCMYTIRIRDLRSEHAGMQYALARSLRSEHACIQYAFQSPYAVENPIVYNTHLEIPTSVNMRVYNTH